MIESVNVLRGAASGVGPGSPGQAERPSSHSLPQCLGEQGGSPTSGRGGGRAEICDFSTPGLTGLCSSPGLQRPDPEPKPSLWGAHS